MNKSTKSLLAGLLLAAVLISLPGCSRTSTENSPSLPQDTAQPEPGTLAGGDLEPVYYSQTVYPFAGGSSVKGIARLGNRLFMYGRKDGVSQLGMAEYAEEENSRVSFGDTTLIAMDAPEAVDEAWIYDITAGEDGMLYVLTGEMPKEYLVNGESFMNPNFQGRYSILRFSPDGAFLEKMPLADWQEAMPNGLLVDKDGRICLYSFQYVALVDWLGEPATVHKLPEDQYLTTASLCRDGFVVTISSTYNTADPASPFYLINKDTGDLTCLSIAGSPDDDGYLDLLFLGSLSCYQGLGGEYIADNGATYLEINFSDGSFATLRQWNYDAYGVSATDTCRLTETAFVCNAEEDHLLINGLELKPHKERSTVNVAVIAKNEFYDNGASLLAEINAQNTDYDYVSTTYYHADLTRLLTELGSGNAPDLLLFDNSVNVDSALFEDLNLYLDADPDLSRDSFIPGLTDLLSANGELHQLWNSVEVNTLLAREADIDDQTDRTPQFYTRLLEENEQYQAVFQGYITRSYLLGMVARIGIIAFTDKENALCYFDDPAFGELLAWCGEQTPEYSGEVVPEEYSHPMEETILFSEILISMERMAALEQYCVFQEPYVFVGFPDGGDGLSYYSCGGFAMAIPAGSSNKEGAWEFIRTQLLPDKQLTLSNGLPVNWEALQRLAEACLDNSGIEKLTALLAAVDCAETYADAGLREIILDCGQAYLSGGRTLEDTIALLQNRASVYVAEQYG